MLREGMLRCLEAKPLSKITVSDLCRESGINRATFYNHYSAPVEILKELGREYGSQLMTIYASGYDRDGGDDRRALEAGLTYLAERKQELKVLFSEHAENFLGVSLWRSSTSGRPRTRGRQIWMIGETNTSCVPQRVHLRHSASFRLG